MSVVILGSLNLDEHCGIAGMLRPGATMLVDGYARAAGGKGLNQAVAAARMGAPVAMIGAVGADAEGRLLHAYLAAAGVDTAGVAALADVGSGRATIMVAPDGENQILVLGGANRRVTPGMATAGDHAAASVFLAQLELPVDAIEAFFSRPEARGARKILNTAPAVPEGARLFGLADMLIFNQSEFAAYLQLDAEPVGEADLLCVRSLLARPNQAAVVTLGAAGAVAVWADRTMTVPGFAADAVDTSGAGDCFCGVVAAAVAQGIGPERAMTLANAAAALTVGRPGAAAAIPARAEVEALIAAAGR